MGKFAYLPMSQDGEAYLQMSQDGEAYLCVCVRAKEMGGCRVWHSPASVCVRRRYCLVRSAYRSVSFITSS